ncbi:MAG: DUF763 domain-containing protein [Nitrososphaerota archaeon]|nr:DUF763 domain-containing protein [Nitrososphaerales archaeon]MDW8044190.1 DUF763 domain-containing protein [Nitrososphaerota archaeon]
MKKSGYVILPLHYGHAPQWLISRMKRLADEIMRIINEEYGPNEILLRISDPYWFQAFGCVLGFDWHSSGLTTVVTGVLRDVLNFERHGVMMAGGKGRASKNTPNEIDKIGEVLGLTTDKIERLKYASRMCAKVDTAAIQAGYPIYHHAFFISETGDWAVVQQGLCEADKTARRYHWHSKNVDNFVVEPHDAIVGDCVRPRVLNMTAREAEDNRKLCVDLVRGNPHNLISSIRRLSAGRSSLDRWLNSSESFLSEEYEAFMMPRNLNWDLFKRLYDYQPTDYEEFIAFRGVGPATVRALALVSELIYGKKASWRDPVKFSFAHGGKDGVPFPVNRKIMDESIRFLKDLIDSSEIKREEKISAFKRLNLLVERWALQ